MIIVCGITILIHKQSKNYRVGRLLSCIFLEENYRKYDNEISFCVKKGLLKKTINDSDELTNIGFDYMSAQNSLHLAMFALIIATFSLCATLISFYVK